MAKKIDLTPTWEAAARIYVNCLRYGKSEDPKNGAQEDLIRLGRNYDSLQTKYNKLIKMLKKQDEEAE